MLWYHVSNRQLVLSGGQRPQYIVQVQVQIYRKPPNIRGNYNIQIYTSNKHNDEIIKPITTSPFSSLLSRTETNMYSK
jgi:hypothetical protein